LLYSVSSKRNVILRFILGQPNGQHFIQLHFSSSKGGGNFVSYARSCVSSIGDASGVCNFKVYEFCNFS
jgi:hypothetical protein